MKRGSSGMLGPGRKPPLCKLGMRIISKGGSGAVVKGRDGMGGPAQQHKRRLPAWPGPGPKAPCSVPMGPGRRAPALSHARAPCHPLLCTQCAPLRHASRLGHASRALPCFAAYTTPWWCTPWRCLAPQMARSAGRQGLNSPSPNCNMMPCQRRATPAACCVGRSCLHRMA